MKSLPRFLVFRYPPGGGGNFISSLLQCSNNVGHWNKNLEYSKPNTDWESWFDRSFNKNLSKWLDTEPIANHDLGTREIFSAWYDRGNTLSTREFLKLEAEYCTPYYFYLKNKNSLIPIAWHKNYMPAYFENSVFIDITLDSTSIKWFDKSWYYKHHRVEYDPSSNTYSVTRNRHRPCIQPSNSSFSNEYKVNYKSFRQLVINEIYNNPWRERYLDSTYLDNLASQQPQYSLKLSDLLNFGQLHYHYKEMCTFLNIDPIDYSMLKNLFTIWRNRHAY